MVDPQDHTMGSCLYGYLDIKVHDWIQKNEFKNIWVIGEYDRNSGISDIEKTGKMFNRERPTAVILGDDLYIRCFPGADYVRHYASLISTYLAIHHRRCDHVRYLLPDESMCWKALLDSNLVKIPNGDIAILGYGLDTLIGDHPTWDGQGNFSWVNRSINNQKVVFIGCHHSYWGDIGGRIIAFLAKKGFKRVIFVGKLGTTRPEISPNTFLATGNMSFVEGETIHWKNCFDFAKNDRGIVFGNHVHIPSVIFETNEWLANNQCFDFVDPEIGHMAKAALSEGIEFSFLHIISDNISKKYDENLSNERKKEVVEKRQALLKKVKGIIEKSLFLP